MDDVFLSAHLQGNTGLLEIQESKSKRVTSFFVFANFDASDGTKPREVLSECGWVRRRTTFFEFDREASDEYSSSLFDRGFLAIHLKVLVPDLRGPSFYAYTQITSNGM